MNAESGFLNHKNPFDVDDNARLDDLIPLSTSKTGFFRILVGKHLGRKVVFKTLKEDAADNPIASAQLNKEFATIFSLDSPNVVKAFRLTTLKDASPAIEMEWCSGSSIRDLFADKISTPDALEIIRGCLNGLQDVHNAGIIHRDIKPENVIYDPFRKVVKIIDFGCAYVTGGIILQGPNGTEAYTPTDKMSSESEPEPKDDLYALGVMTAEIAENLTLKSKKEAEIKKKLSLFSSRLMEGKYAKASDAADDFEKLIKDKRPLRMAAAAIITVILLCSIFFLIRPLLNRSTQPEVTSVALNSDTAASPELTKGDNDLEANQTKSLSESTPTPKTDEQKGSTDSQAPVTKALSMDDKAVFELAIFAGPVFLEAESENASLQSRMDVFVMNFSDSIYRAEKIQTTYPHNLNDAEMRRLAKQLADSHLHKMEQAFQRQFGKSGDPHRRAILFEGRFYCSLFCYHQ